MARGYAQRFQCCNITSTSVPRAFEAEWGTHQGCLQPSVVEKAGTRSSATVAMFVVLVEEKHFPGVGCLQPTCLGCFNKRGVHLTTMLSDGNPTPQCTGPP